MEIPDSVPTISRISTGFGDSLSRMVMLAAGKTTDLVQRRMFFLPRRPGSCEHLIGVPKNADPESSAHLFERRPSPPSALESGHAMFWLRSRAHPEARPFESATPAFTVRRVSSRR